VSGAGASRQRRWGWEAGAESLRSLADRCIEMSGDELGAECGEWCQN